MAAAAVQAIVAAATGVVDTTAGATAAGAIAATGVVYTATGATATTVAWIAATTLGVSTSATGIVVVVGGAA